MKKKIFQNIFLILFIISLLAIVNYAMAQTQKDMLYPQDWINENETDIFKNLTYKNHILKNLKNPYDNDKYILLPSIDGTYSMCPAYGDGCSYIIKQDVMIKDIEVGDVVAYQSDKGNILHRVVSKYDTHLITKGDNNNFDDLRLFGFFVTDENIIGVLVGVIY